MKYRERLAGALGKTLDQILRLKTSAAFLCQILYELLLFCDFVFTNATLPGYIAAMAFLAIEPLATNTPYPASAIELFLLSMQNPHVPKRAMSLGMFAASDW